MLKRTPDFHLEYSVDFVFILECSPNKWAKSGFFLFMPSSRILNETAPNKIASEIKECHTCERPGVGAIEISITIITENGFFEIFDIHCIVPVS